MGEHGFTWFSYIPYIADIEPHVSVAIFVLILLTVLAYFGFRNLANQNSPMEAFIPSDRLTFRNIFEIISEMFLNFLDDIVGPHGRRFLPLIGTLGCFILFSNLLGLVPGFVPPTSNLNTTVACALIVFFTTHYVGVRTHGFRYVKQFLGPVWWLAPIMLVIEVISHLARPLSLSMRLFGNIMADHMILALTLVAPSFLVILFPPLSLALGVFVSVIQTLIFTILSMTYISFALAEEH
jgi:F-type H+-transporting ATPase subunit a